MWDLSSPTRDSTWALGSPNHWPTREFPVHFKFFFVNCGKIHITKFTICKWTVLWHSLLMQPSPHCISRIFSSSPTETLSHQTITPHSSLPEVPGNQHSTFSFYGFDYSFFFLIFIYLFIYLFIWLCRVLVAAHRLLSSCGASA